MMLNAANTTPLRMSPPSPRMTQANPSRTQAQVLVRYTQQATPLGDVFFACTEQGLVGCWFHDQAHLPLMQGWQRDDAHALLTSAHQQWLRYFSGQLKAFDLPLHFLWGTAFQQSVWHALQRIPHGRTTTYAELAGALHRPNASRAVGAAVGRNPLSVVVPCHRVLGAKGALTGYAGGLERKQALLQLEQQHA